MESNRKPTFKEAFRYWHRLGWVSFGGPVAQVALMHEELVVQKKWVPEDQFKRALTLCTLLPGPEAQQLATYLGWTLHGTRGALTAGLLFIIPSILILLLLATLFVHFGHVTWVASFVSGLKPAVFAFIASATIKIAKKNILNDKEVWVALSAFFMALIHIPYAIIFLGALLLGGYWAKKNQFGTLDHGSSQHVMQLLTRHNWHYSFVVICAIALGWLLPLALILWGHFQPLWFHKLALFFTGTAVFSLGGAYTVLPYVWQGVVAKHWLSNGDMISALALGETTPGPLIMIVAFVGYVATWSQIHPLDASRDLFALIGGMVAVWYTFLPSFLGVLLGAPIVEKLGELPDLKNIFSTLFAAVVGMMLLIILRTVGSMLQAQHWGGSLIHLLIGLVAFWILWRSPKIPPWSVVLGCGVLGMIIN